MPSTSIILHIRTKGQCFALHAQKIDCAHIKVGSTSINSPRSSLYRRVPVIGGQFLSKTNNLSICQPFFFQISCRHLYIFYVKTKIYTLCLLQFHRQQPPNTWKKVNTSTHKENVCWVNSVLVESLNNNSWLKNWVTNDSYVHWSWFFLEANSCNLGNFILLNNSNPAYKKFMQD